MKTKQTTNTENRRLDDMVRSVMTHRTVEADRYGAQYRADDERAVRRRLRIRVIAVAALTLIGAVGGTILYVTHENRRVDQQKANRLDDARKDENAGKAWLEVLHLVRAHRFGDAAAKLDEYWSRGLTTQKYDELKSEIEASEQRYRTDCMNKWQKALDIEDLATAKKIQAELEKGNDSPEMHKRRRALIQTTDEASRSIP